MSSSLLHPITAQALFTSTITNKQNTTPTNLRVIGETENEVDDYIFPQGLPARCICGISASSSATATNTTTAEDDVGQIFCMSLIVTTLLSCSDARVLVVDSLGSFSVVLLQRTLKERICRQNERERLRSGGGGGGPGGDEEDDGDGDVDGLVQSCLGRVDISRVFDVEGLWEVLREVGSSGGSGISEDVLPEDEGEGEDEISLTEPRAAADQTGAAGNVADKASVDDGASEEIAAEAFPDEKEIRDSQSEDLDFDSSPPIQEAGQAEELCSQADSQVEKDQSRTQLVIVDNMTTLINELFSRVERNAAHQTLTTLSRTLSTIATRQNLTMVLTNTLSAINANKPSATSKPSNKPVSIFTGTTLRPSLGQIFTDMVQLHLLITSVPRSREDAEALCSFDGNPDGPQPKKPRRHHRVVYSHIVEVLKDICPMTPLSSDSRVSAEEQWNQIQQQKQTGKLKRREQRWCALDVIRDDVGIAVGLRDAFDTGKGMKAMGQIRPGKIGPRGHILNVTMDVGGVAKVFGFGGRRV